MIIKDHSISATKDMNNNNDIQENDIIIQNNLLSDIVDKNTNDTDT